MELVHFTGEETESEKGRDLADGTFSLLSSNRRLLFKCLPPGETWHMPVSQAPYIFIGQCFTTDDNLLLN